jgi:hypothetical protein
MLPPQILQNTKHNMKDDSQPTKYTILTLPWQCEKLSHLIKKLTTENQKKISSLSHLHAPIHMLHAHHPTLSFPSSCPHASILTCKKLALTVTGNNNGQQRLATAIGNSNGMVNGNGQQ